MKARDLHPCDWCNKPIAGRGPDGRITIQFYVVTLATAVLDPQAVNQHMGLALMTGSDRLAEIFTSKPDVALIIEDQPGAGGRDEALLCFNCWAGFGEPTVRLAALAERVAERKAVTAADQDSRGVGVPATAGVRDPTSDPRSLPRKRRAPVVPPEEAK